MKCKYFFCKHPMCDQKQYNSNEECCRENNDYNIKFDFELFDACICNPFFWMFSTFLVGVIWYRYFGILCFPTFNAELDIVVTKDIYISLYLFIKT